AILFVLLGFSAHQIYHLARFGHLAPLALHADIIIRRVDAGIPGVSKDYEAGLTNYGVKPVTVMACDFVSDASESGRIVPYAIERWNPVSRSWQTVLGYDTSAFCRSYPLGISQAHLVSTRLWLGQSISTGSESTAAREEFSIGDRPRFVVFGQDAHRPKSAFATIAFSIDEHPYSEVPLRIRH